MDREDYRNRTPSFSFEQRDIPMEDRAGSAQVGFIREPSSSRQTDESSEFLNAQLTYLLSMLI